jgi:hypothetical protein
VSIHFIGAFPYTAANFVFIIAEQIMPDLESLFTNNIDWAESIKQEDPHFFSTLAQQQAPAVCPPIKLLLWLQVNYLCIATSPI